ncbi:MAG: GspH/FimT family pseudopilin [Armatimonadota bacterium]
MGRWQRWNNGLFRIENGLIIGLLLLAALLAWPAVRSLTASNADQASRELAARLQAIEQRARNEGYVYTVTFKPQTGNIMVTRWVQAGQDDDAHAETVAVLSKPLSGGVVVLDTTLQDGEITISDNGFTLSKGRISLRAPDGSKAAFEVSSEL